MKVKLMVIATALIGVVGGFFLAQGIITGDAKEKIDANEAKSIALKTANGKIVEIEYDNDELYPHYEFEIATNNEKVELDVDANTGKVVVKERKSISINNPAPNETQKNFNTKESNNTAVQQKGSVSNDQNLISQEKAISIALEKAKGQVTDVELDNENGIWIYEIEIRDGNVENDFEIDAKTGAIIKFKKEVDFD